MKKVKIVIAAMALVLTAAGATYAANASDPNDCAVQVGLPGSIDSSTCTGTGATCCFLVDGGMEIQKSQDQ
jgi:hypothetical protein